MNQQEQIYSTDPQPSIKLFSPELIAGFTFLTTFPVGYVLSTINWHRLGNEEKKRQYIIWSVISTLFLAFLVVFANLNRLVPLIINIVFAKYFHAEMNQALSSDDQINFTYTKENWLKGIPISIAVILIWLILIFILILGTEIFSPTWGEPDPFGFNNL